MRGATECARRVKLVFSSLRSKLGKVGHPPITDPITQLILGVLSRDTAESKACEGLERLRAMVVDYNELRVIPPIELAGVLGDFPDARLKCEDISRALNAIFAHEHSISLERMGSLPHKEVALVLERVAGLEPYTRARIRLLGFRQHAIPLDEAMWAGARDGGLVAPRCSLDEAQQFLERQIAEEDALEFFALWKRHAWSEFGAAVRKRSVERIQSVPPDRTSRNMLQMITGGSLEPADESPEPPEDWEGEAPPPATPRNRAPKSGKAAAAKSARRPTDARRAKTRARATPPRESTPRAGKAAKRSTQPAARSAKTRPSSAARRTPAGRRELRKTKSA